MILRRALYYAQFPLAVVMPVWILISRGIIADDSGWMFVIYLIATPILFVLLAILSALILARKKVRVERAVSWVDAWFLLGLWAAFLLFGFFAVFPLAAITTLVLVATFWVVVAELIDETRTRVKGFVDDMAFTTQRPGQRIVQAPGDAGPIIVVPPTATRSIDEKSQN